MWSWTGSIWPHVVLWWSLGGCAQLLGADDIEYTVPEGAGRSATDEGGNGGVPETVDDSGAGESGAGKPGFGMSGAGGAGGGQAGSENTLGGSECEGREGPEPVNIQGLFCIDSTEVTNAQYLEFLGQADGIEQPAECSWNVTAEGAGDFEPGIDHLWPPAEAALDLPVGGVDWCDAWSYCEWAGKRLCSRVDGSPPTFADYSTTNNELFYACSRGGERDYPYGDTFDPAACVTVDRDAPEPVGSFMGCEGGFEGLYDLSGNVGEWQAGCDGRAGGTDSCRLGSFGVARERTADAWRCDTAYSMFRQTITNAIGIRCCSDVR